MRPWTRAIVSTVLYLGLAAAGLHPLAAEQPRPRLFDPKLLAPAVAQERSPVERTIAAIAGIRHEIRLPSEGSLGAYSTRHEDMLAWILSYVGGERHRDGFVLATLRRAAFQAPPGEERDMLLLFRGAVGDQEVAVDVAGYLADVRKPINLRCAAANALGHLKHPRTIEALVQMLEGDMVWISMNKRSVVNTIEGNFKSYIVRWSAKQALAAYDCDNLLPDRYKPRLEKAVTSVEFTDQEWDALYKASLMPRAQPAF